MTETKFGKALEKILVQEIFESQCDNARKGVMLTELFRALGVAITFACDGDRKAIERASKSSSKIIAHFATSAIDSYSTIGSPLN